MPHFPNIFLISDIRNLQRIWTRLTCFVVKSCFVVISQRSMSNGFIYVVDAHFIDKIERKKIQDPSKCLWYFCTHENIIRQVIILSFPNNKISIFTGRPPPISSTFNSMSMLFLSKLNLLQYNRKCSEHSFLYPHEQEAIGTKFDLNKSLFRELHLLLSLACNTLRYRSSKEK